MKKQVTVEVNVCDICKKNDASDHNLCLSCKKHFCYECLDKHGVKYKHALNFSGSYDGLYCKECDNKMSFDSTDKLYLAYKEIERLRKSQVIFYGETKRMADIAESVIEANFPRR